MIKIVNITIFTMQYIFLIVFDVLNVCMLLYKLSHIR
jgi:hypothetical protein